MLLKNKRKWEIFSLEISLQERAILLTGVSCLNLDETLDCGQCFRFVRQQDGSYRGIVRETLLHITALSTDSFLLEGTTLEEFENIWFDYFDLGLDYEALKARYREDETMRRALCYAPGIRVLKQEPWEALCTFIISQNNNIPRIKGIVERFCEAFGKPLGRGEYAFPTPESICSKAPEDLSYLRAGFRAKYLIDAAQKVASGELVLENLCNLPIDEARQALQVVKGVGPKVCDCVLLYGLHRLDAFPVDVWIKRVLERFYPQGTPACIEGTQGIAQQYLFHYIRHLDEAEQKEEAKCAATAM